MTGHNRNKVFPEKLLDFLPRMFMSSCVWEKELPPRCMEKWRLEILEAWHRGWAGGCIMWPTPKKDSRVQLFLPRLRSCSVLALHMFSY